MRVRLGRSFTLVFVLSLVLGALQAAPAAATSLAVLRTGFAYTDHSVTYPSSGGIGPLGLAFGAGGALYALGPDGRLYLTPSGGGAPAVVATVPGPTSGLTMGRNGKLYLTRQGASPSVVEYEPVGGATRDILPGLIPGPHGIATDPLTGDLMVAGDDGFVYRIEGPGSATPVLHQFREIQAGVPLHAISVISDGTIFVNARDQIFKASGIGRPTQVGSVVTQANLGGFVVVTRADDAGNPIPRFIYANRTDGFVTKIDIIESGRRFDVLGGGTRGDHAVIGPDECLYATQSDAVIRVRGAADTGIQCDLAAAGEEAPFLVISYTGTGARVGGSPQTVVASLTGRNVGGRVVTFTRTGANPGVVTATTSSGGIATMTYTGTAVGTDVITATAQPEFGLPVSAVSSVSIEWRPALDATGPVIRPVVTGTRSTTNFACPDYNFETATTTSCGYFVTPPSITWVITDPDGTAIDVTRTNLVNCPNYPAPFTLIGNSPPSGTPVACQAWNVDGAATTKTVILNAIVTPPTIVAQRSPAPNTQGWNTGDVTVSFLCGFPAGEHSRLSCTTPQTVTGQTLGTTVNGLAEDIAGNRADLGVLVKIDRTEPTITASLSRPADANGWHTAPVTVSFSCSDSGAVASGLATCSPPVVVGTEGIQTVTGTAADVAGNVRSASVTVKLDLTGPRIDAAPDRAPGPGGWYNAPVTVTFTCAPGASGAAVTGCSGPRTVTSDGAAQAVTGSATDQAGLITTATLPVSVDTAPPMISGAPTTPANAAGWHRGDVTIVFSCSDALSGVLACPPSVTVGAEGINPPVTASVSDVAGNLGSTSVPGVKVDRTAPATVSSFTGTQFGGVYHDQVNVTLSAADALSGVASITYSATGAQSIASTTVTGSSASLVIGAPGTTTLTYFATDAAGNVEAPRTLTLTTSDPEAPSIVMTGGTVTYDGLPHPVAATATATGWTLPLAVTYEPGGTTPPTQAGTYTATASFAGDALRRPATATVTLNIEKATPELTWPAPAPITYGTPLSAAQQNASAAGAGGGSLTGGYTYTPLPGTVLDAGPHTLSVTFTPADTANYTTATMTVPLTVGPATPAISWPTPAPITYGTPLGTALNATASGTGGAPVPGGFTYTTATGTVLTAGSVLPAGTHTLTATFTPTTPNYTTATQTATLTVGPATPAISWPTPATITYGTPLSPTQLNATASSVGGATVPGGFTYTSATGAVLTAGSVLPAGTHTLTATFTPTTPNYTTATRTVTLTVVPATPTITWPAPAPIAYGTPLSPAQLNALASGIGGALLAGTFAYSPAAGTVVGAGSQTLSVTFTPSDPSYGPATRTVTLVVTAAAPTLTWPAPASVLYGTPLSATQLNASATGLGGAVVAGSFGYTPGAGTVLPVGTHTLQATFTPSDPNYRSAGTSATLTVDKAPATVTLTLPAAEVPFGSPYTVSARATGPGGLDVPVTDITYVQGAVTTATPPTASGTYTVIARYPGGPSHLPAEALGTLTIGPEAIATTLSVPPSTQTWSAAGATVRATLAAARGSVAGLTLTFTVDGRTFTAVTDATGTATVTVPGLVPGTYTVTAAFAGLGIIQPSSGSGRLDWARELGVGALGCGDLHTSSLWFAGANVKVNAQVKCDGSTIKGKIDVDPIKSGRKLTITKFTGFGRTADLRQAFVFGTTDDGRPVVVIVEITDAARVGDKFELRIANVAVTGDGIVKKGDVRIKAGTHCDTDRTGSRGD